MIMKITPDDVAVDAMLPVMGRRDIALAIFVHCKEAFAPGRRVHCNVCIYMRLPPVSAQGVSRTIKAHTALWRLAVRYPLHLGRA